MYTSLHAGLSCQSWRFALNLCNLITHKNKHFGQTSLWQGPSKMTTTFTYWRRTLSLGPVWYHWGGGVYGIQCSPLPGGNLDVYCWGYVAPVCIYSQWSRLTKQKEEKEQSAKATALSSGSAEWGGQGSQNTKILSVQQIVQECCTISLEHLHLFKSEAKDRFLGWGGQFFDAWLLTMIVSEEPKDV